MIEKPLLRELWCKGKSLAEISVHPREGVDLRLLIDALNSLGPDVVAGEGVYNTLIRDGRVPGYHLPFASMEATREALERLFGWKLRRALCPIADPVTREIVRYHADAYYWEEVATVQFMPPELEGMIASIGLSQPGSNDEGNNDTVDYSLPQSRPN
jgi:hypothetical protein